MFVEKGVAGITNFLQRCIEDLETEGSLVGVCGSNEDRFTNAGLGKYFCCNLCGDPFVGGGAVYNNSIYIVYALCWHATI